MAKKAFDAWYKLEIQLEKYKITIGPERGKVWGDRAYNELYSLEELAEFADRFVELWSPVPQAPNLPPHDLGEFGGVNLETS